MPTRHMSSARRRRLAALVFLLALAGVLPASAGAQGGGLSRLPAGAKAARPVKDPPPILSGAPLTESLRGLWFRLPEDCSPTVAWLGGGGLLTRLEHDGYVTTWEYDRHGNPLVELTTDESEPDSTWRRFDCAYEGGGELHKGKLVRKTRTGSGRFPSSWEGYRATYDGRDRYEVETEELDFNRDGVIDHLFHVRYEYGPSGLLVGQRFEWDFNADGVVDSRLIATATYDEQRRVRQIIRGQSNVRDGTFTLWETFTVTVDDAAGSVSSAEEEDYDSDGVMDDLLRWTIFKDEAGRTTRILYEIDYYGRADGGADGTIDSAYDDRYQYDAGGYLIGEVYDSMSDGVLDSTLDYRFTNDARGRLALTRTTSFFYVNGTATMRNEIETTTYVRDQRGRVVDELAVLARPGFVDNTRTQYRFDAVGNLLELIETRWWNDEPATVERHYLYEYAAGRSGQAKEGAR
jgi:hypothetical protein